MIHLLISLAAAQDFEETDKELTEAEEAQANLSAEFGASLTTGNTDYWTVQSTLAGGYRWNANKISIVAGALSGKGRVDGDGDGLLSDDELKLDRVDNARKYYADGRYDRYLGKEKSSIYVLGGALHDPFSGYDLRTHEQVGYSRLLVNSDSTELVVEIGVDYAQENYVAGVDPNSANVLAGRLMLGLSHQLSESVAFTDRVEVYEAPLNPADVRVLNQAALNVGLNDKLALKLSHQLTYDNQPVEGYRPLDQTSMLTVVASIL